jgi:ribosome-binding factor A
MDPAKTRRLAERISKIVASMLERRIKDPRLGFVTVTETRLTNDLREATVFYTVFGSPEEREDTAAALKSATGVIRSEVGRIMGLRHTPSLTFIADEVPEDAQHIEELVATARQRDEELAKSREGAEWAGDPDPYRKPAEDEDEWDEDDDAVLADDGDAAVLPDDGD